MTFRDRLLATLRAFRPVLDVLRDHQRRCGPALEQVGDLGACHQNAVHLDEVPS